MAERAEWTKWTNLKQAQESAHEPRQAVLSLNQGTNTKNSRCDPNFEASYAKQMSVMDGIKLAVKLLAQGIIIAVCGVIFFTIILGAICTLLGL